MIGFRTRIHVHFRGNRRVKVETSVGFHCSVAREADWRVDWTLNSEVPGSSPALTNRLICFSVVPDPAPRPLPADIFKDVAFDLDLFEDIELGIWVYQYSCYCKMIPY